MEFNYNESKKIRKALALALEKMRENKEIEENEDRYYLLDSLYEKFSELEDELEEEEFQIDINVEM